MHENITLPDEAIPGGIGVVGKRKSPYTIATPDGIVTVSKPVYTAWKHYENKENYFMGKQKEETFLYDPEKLIAAFLPSREDSFDRLSGEGLEFAVDQSSVEDRAIAAVMVDNLMEQLSEQEQQALYLRCCLEKTMDESARALGFSSTAFKRYMRSLIAKCHRILEKEAK